MGVFQGCYQDGVSNGSTRDYRILAGLHLIGRLLIDVCIARKSTNYSVDQHYSFLLTATCFILTSVFFAILKPFRQWSHNIINIIILLWIAKLCVVIHVAFEMSITDENLKIVLIVLLIDFAAPPAVLLFYTSYKIASLARQICLKQLCDNLKNKSHQNELHACEPQTNEEQPLLL